MEVIITPDYEAMSRYAAEIVARLLYKKPNAVLGLATGSTPLGLYRELIRMHRQEGLDFSKVTTFNLDEYVGVPAEHPQSYHRFMWDNLFSQVNVSPSRVHVPNGMVRDMEEYCEWYEAEIVRAGGIDLQVLGIGRDGHIAFNEPGSSLGSRTRIKTLARETVEDNARFFDRDEDVPRHAVTMGVGTIMEARRCLLLASGAAKAQPVAATVEGPVTCQVTASALQLHRDAVAVLDSEAAGALARRDYYEWVFRHKETWHASHRS